MNGQLRKKSTERFQLERFLEAAPEFSDAEIVDHDCEAPDFIVTIHGRNVGIELTSVHVPGGRSHRPMQAEESMAEEIVRLARARYVELLGPPVTVNAFFSSLSSVRSRDTKIIADRIADLVRQLHLVPWQESEITPSRMHEFDPALDGIIAFFHVMGVPNPEWAHWMVDRAGWHATLTQAMLQECVGNKAPLLPSYRKKVKENWLVIVANRSAPSQMLDPDPALDWAKVGSPFNRTYFFAYPFFELRRLGT